MERYEVRPRRVIISYKLGGYSILLTNKPRRTGKKIFSLSVTLVSLFGEKMVKLRYNQSFTTRATER